MRRSAATRRVCALLAAVAATQPGFAAARTAAARQLTFQSSFTAETPMETTASSASPVGGTTSSMNLQKSTDIVSGMVESFLHSEPLQPGELECISSGTGQLAGDVTSVASQMVMVMEAIMGGKNGVAGAATADASAAASGPAATVAGSGPAPVSSSNLGDGANDIAAKVDSMFSAQSSAASSSVAAPPAPAASSIGGAFAAPATQAAPVPATTQSPAQVAAQQEQAKKTSQSMNLFYGSRRLQGLPTSVDGSSSSGASLSPSLAMSAPGLMMQFGFNMKSIMNLAHKMVQQCVHGDALKALDTAAEHMQSMEYVSGHFMANGQDVIEELSKAVLSWKQGDAKGFGQNFGMAARKVLLSSSGSNGLPEGLPGKEVLANVSAGMLNGMFGPGASMDINIPGDVDHAPETAHIDLHNCVQQNLPFFQSAWAETMFFFAKRHAKVVEDKEKMQWGTAVAFTMMQAPSAMEKCGISQQQSEMLMDSIKAMETGGLDVDLHLPQSNGINKDKATTEFATAAKDWANMKWYTFGNDMGKIMLQSASTVYQKKYYIGPDGGLKKRIIELSEEGTKAPFSGLNAIALCALCAMGVMPVAGAVGLRMTRALRPAAYDQRAPLYLETEDVESGSERDFAAVE